MEKPIIFTNLPPCEELCHILVSIDPYEKKDKSVKSDFQWQLLKTRLLLYSEKDILATPAAGLLRYIHVISKKEYLNSGSLSTVFQRLKLKVESVGALSFPMYEQCLIHNLIVKLSPFWNKVEKYFVEGRYFLMHRGALHAIELNIILKGDMLMLYASPLRLWLREVSLCDLLPSSNMKETITKPFYIDLHSDRQWVHVLPSFKRGHLVYVTNYIPKDSTFEDYQQMRRHWKNTYGYRLPEDDSSPIYVGVSFFGNKDFLYPLQCVRRGMHMNMDEPNGIVNFAKSVDSKASFVCGNRIKLRNLMELQSMPKIKLSERLKWSEAGLAELDSDLMNKWLFPSDESLNNTYESQNISLYTEPEQCEMSSTTIEDGHNKKQDYDNWLTKCSQFIDKLTQGGQRRSFLKANRPHFYGPSRHSSLKVNLEPQPSISAISKIEECSFNNEKESYQSNTLFKPCFDKIESNACGKIESVDILSKEHHEVHTTMGHYNGTIFENNFGLENELSLVNGALSHNVPFRPVFKKKIKEAVKSFEEEKKKFSRPFKSKPITSKSSMNVKKNIHKEDIQKKRKKNKLQVFIEILKESNIASEMGADIKMQETDRKVNDMYCEEVNQMVVDSGMSAIEAEKFVENQVTNQRENILISNFEECLHPLPNSAEVVEDKSKINRFVSDMQALPVMYEKENNIISEQIVLERLKMPAITPKEDKLISFISDIQEFPLLYENKNIDIMTKQSVVKRLKTPSSAPKERKKAILLTTAEIENLVFMNQLEKANVPSLCCYLKSKGVPFSKDKKKNILIEKVKEIIMPSVIE